MKTSGKRIVAAFLVGLAVTVIVSGCRRVSESVEDSSAGINGGFEIVSNGLPVNWIMYTPNTVPDAVFQIAFDKEVFKEGKQSLRFDVKRCAERGGGWHSPGFTNEFFEGGKGGFGEGRYRISFWVRNSGSTYCIAAGGVAYMKKVGGMNTLIQTNESNDDWKRLEYEVDVPEEAHLRLQLTILEPGTFWIDDIRIERIDGDST